MGWLGTASTGSDTSTSNVLFGSLQENDRSANRRAACPDGFRQFHRRRNGQNDGRSKLIVVASTATQTYGKEGSILRFVFDLHSIALACLVGILVYLMAYVYPFTLLVPR